MVHWFAAYGVLDNSTEWVCQFGLSELQNSNDKYTV